MSWHWQQKRQTWLALAISLLALPQNAAADPNKTSDQPALASWQGNAHTPSLVIPLAGILSDKQRNIITGGFTTVSQLSLYLAPTDDDEQSKPNEEALGPPLTQVRCTVKFDAWEETFDVARLDRTPRAATFKNFSEFARLCLTASWSPQDSSDPKLSLRLRQSGGVLFAFLTIKQTSPEEAARIRDWLIQQQSGVMQGLFAHMLGELMFSQSVSVRIDLPPVSRTPSPKQPSTLPALPSKNSGTSYE